MESVQLNKAQYNYLIAVPPMRRNLLVRYFGKRTMYIFIGNTNEISDMWRRMKGLSW